MTLCEILDWFESFFFSGEASQGLFSHIWIKSLQNTRSWDHHCSMTKRVRRQNQLPSAEASSTDPGVDRVLATSSGTSLLTFEMTQVSIWACILLLFLTEKIIIKNGAYLVWRFLWGFRTVSGKEPTGSKCELLVANDSSLVPVLSAGTSASSSLLSPLITLTFFCCILCVCRYIPQRALRILEAQLCLFYHQIQIQSHENFLRTHTKMLGKKILLFKNRVSQPGNL